MARVLALGSVSDAQCPSLWAENVSQFCKVLVKRDCQGMRSTNTGLVGIGLQVNVGLEYFQAYESFEH